MKDVVARVHTRRPATRHYLGMLEKDRPPILGLIQHGGEVVLYMLLDVQQRTTKQTIMGAVTLASPHRVIQVKS